MEHSTGSQIRRRAIPVWAMGRLLQYLDARSDRSYDFTILVPRSSDVSVTGNAQCVKTGWHTKVRRG
jgi:hypothetical protein